HAAPDGTVTILFTDIEGYTAMTERLGDLRAQEVLRAHNAIIREQVTAHGGFEVKSQGDGFMVAFSSARRAILCAIAMQRESAGDIPFGEGRPVKLKGLAGVRQVFEVGWAGSAAAERQAAVAPEARNVFRCEGEYWTLGFDGKLCRVHDAKGLHDIAQLLRHPGEQFEARVLVAAGAGGGVESPVIELTGDDLRGMLGDAGPLLDARAKATYRRGLKELREELEETERFHDARRAARARAEMEALTALAGLTVTKRIKDAVGRIRESHPALGAHLAARVKTGSLCFYDPD